MEPLYLEKDEVITFPYIFSQPRIGDVIVFKHIVPPFIYCKKIKKIINDDIWVEGENKEHSIDSRKFGFIKRKNIIGRVLFKL